MGFLPVGYELAWRASILAENIESRPLHQYKRHLVRSAVTMLDIHSAEGPGCR
jgi:hypothetical protein